VGAIDGTKVAQSPVIDAGGGFFVSAQVGTGFADALEEVLEIGVFHGDGLGAVFGVFNH